MNAIVMKPQVVSTPRAQLRLSRSRVNLIGLPASVRTHTVRSAVRRSASLHVKAVLADAPRPREEDRTTEHIAPHPLQDGNPLRAPADAREDPWTDPKWVDTQWTVFRGVAYDLTDFLEKHPGGNWLINLAIKRDSTGLFESYHLRPEVAAAPLRRLPVLEGFPVSAVPRAPYPNDSKLYNTIRERCRVELFNGGKKGEHRTGSEWAAFCVLGFAAACYAMYAAMPNIITGAILGCAGAWIGLTIQHCGNHGAMSTKPWVNNCLGMCMDLIGGSSLMWRYHHQVSHHLHCNDTDMDEDVYSSFPMLRFDARLPKYWYHKYQHMYMWLAFPLMQVAFEVGDLKAFFARRTAGATLHGADNKELATVLLGKVAHWGLLLTPLAFGASAATIAGTVLAYALTQGVVLASLFAVSHNLAETKNPEWLETKQLRDDWAVQQILTSANWGSWIGCFFTGGLNLQIEHHLFPAVSFMHYPNISKIVKEEATKVGIPYAEYKYLPTILAQFQKFMKSAGEAPAPEGNLFPVRGGIGKWPVVTSVVNNAPMASADLGMGVSCPFGFKSSN
mmetsp:Transcript_20975/g.35178  ORF Transcript_20975/g.35178 Transcript_20975/m.35178 type:complete len:561 (-) Transcript_20975:446-2128(-)|eukprot:CAMPEP_0198199760 /NCGR_PEP_ID=MMETSP1445-20131203/2934_1 /TAXON_ID=36898 /ORGANISM="Pyramimonas sp., Strain CCMP2087" /LENGTH=560 /DNA_ID=CAMNT_0043869653 /DNA_START=138 /DNA_END=1820 /DNA_ORIENTATION=-